MKKIIYSFTLIALSLMSCQNSSDDIDSNLNGGDGDDNGDGDVTNTILPTQLVIQYANNDTETLSFTYDGIKLIKQESTDGYYMDYIYNNDILSEINYYDTASGEEILETYGYDSQQRVANVSVNIVGVGVYDYTQTYSTDGTIMTQSSVTNPNASTYSMTFINGNITKSSEESLYKTSYTYDDNNAAFKNILGKEHFLLIDYENNDATNFTLNNLLTEATVDNNNNFISGTQYTYTYTDLNYPKTVIENEDGDTTTYTYMYNNE
ncbi:hypothetical protein [Lacinutrix chionoecetis]